MKAQPAQPVVTPERKVGIAEIAVLRGGGTLRTLLGSCIGVALFDRKASVGGIAHIVLPRAQADATTPGKYADTAIPELIRQVEAAGGKVSNLTARLAGGANMFATSSTNTIGDQNLAVVQQILSGLRIPVTGSHCGGQQGRRMSLDIATGIVIIEVVGQPPVEL